MLYDIGLIIVLSIIVNYVFKKINLPSLIGLIILGIVLSSNQLNLLNESFYVNSSTFRSLALIIILMRAGLALKLSDLRHIGIASLLIAFIPATFEIIATIIIAPLFFSISYLDAALMGCVIAAVSPAIIVPRMIKLINEDYSQEKKIPQLIMTGASLDDIYVIILFTSFLDLSKNSSFNFKALLNIPISIFLGIIIGIILGNIIYKMIILLKLDTISKTLLTLGIAFILVYWETYSIIKYSALLSVMSIGATLYHKNSILSKELESNYEKLWSFASIFLFVLVGTSINVNILFNNGLSSIIVILIVLVFRSIGVLLALSPSDFNHKEKLFCVIAYLPKATVQAALASIPLSNGIQSGYVILVIGITSILITAPIGAYLIDKYSDRLLN